MELSDPFAALALSVEDIPDVFILDIGMPGMDGHELARRLRGQQASAGKTLIAVTGYAAPIGSTCHNGRSLFDHYLVKPIELPELVNLLDTLGAA